MQWITSLTGRCWKITLREVGWLVKERIRAKSWIIAGRYPHWWEGFGWVVATGEDAGGANRTRMEPGPAGCWVPPVTTKMATPEDGLPRQPRLFQMQGRGESGSLGMSRMAGKPSWPSRKDLVRVSRGIACGVSIGQAGWNLGETRESKGATGHLSCAEGQQATIGLERPGPAPGAPATCSMRSRPCIAGRARPCRTAMWRSPDPGTTSTSTLTNLALPRIPEVPLRPGRDAWLPE